jgi:hypothetical protein
MANMYNINALSYKPSENPEWFTRAMFGGRLIQGGYIRVLTGIKGDELLSMIDLENKILQIDGADCAWTPNQLVKLSEKTASVKTYKINTEQCINELESKRTVHMLSPGAQNEALPDELEAATLQLIGMGLSNEIEEMLIGGKTATNPNEIDGMVTQLLASTEATKLVGATITTSNVLAAVEAVYNAIPEEVLQAEDAGTLYCLCSYATRRKIRSALAALGNQVIAPNWTIDGTDNKNPRMYYLGMEIVPAKGIDNNTLVGYDSSNAFLLTDLESDLEQIELGQFPKPNEDKVFIKGRLRMGFVIPFESECVIWSSAISTAQSPADSMNDLRVVPNSLVFEQDGQTKTFTVITADEAAEITVTGAGAPGFTVTAGTTTDGVTVVTVVAADGTGSRDPRVGQVKVSIDDTDRFAFVTLNQRNDSEHVSVEA